MSAAGRAACLATAVLLAAGRLAAQETSLTIYQDGSALVRRTIGMPVPRGAGTLQLDLGATQADPATFLALDEGVVLRSVRVLTAAGRDASLQRAVGRDIDFASGTGDSLRLRRGTLLSVNPPAVRIEGRVLFSLPGEPAFPDSLALIAPRYEVVTESPRALPSLRLGFLAQGLSWRASYATVVPRAGGGPAVITGVATIDNAGLTVRNAELQLASGNVRRVAERGGLRLQPGVAMRAAAPATVMDVDVDAEAVAEIRLYTLPGRADLVPGATASLALFTPVAAEVDRLFMLRQPRAFLSQYGESADSNVHPDVLYRIRRPAGSAFGEVALPEGTMRLFATDTEGRLQLLGEAAVGATPRGRDLEVVTGTAVDIVADRVQTTFETRDRREFVIGYRVRVVNGKDESVTVVVDEVIPGRWEILDSTVPAERLTASRVRFTLPLQARGEQVLEYRARVRP